MRVDESGAQKVSAWYRGRDILATVLAMLPLPIYERLSNDGGAVPAKAHPLYDVLHDKPNEWQDSFQWRRQKMYHLVDYGNGYDFIVPGGRGFVDQLHPIHPTLVTPTQLDSGRVVYRVRNPKTAQSVTYTQDEIFHLRGASDDGVVGKGILEVARTSLGTAIATESYAAGIFGKGTLNGGVITVPGLLDEEASKRMAKSWVTAVGDWHLPKILEEGSKWVESKMTPEDAQMLLSRKFSVDDMARWLGVSRMMLENNDPSFGNAEQFDQNFITYTMGPWLSLFEFAIGDQLILNPSRFYVQFTREAIVRGALAVRWNAHVQAVNAGIKTVDEVRAVENLNKRGGKADELRDPKNITGNSAADPSASGEPPADQPADDPPPPPTKKAPPAAASSDARVRAIVTASAARLLRKEQFASEKAALKYAGDSAGFAGWATAFYASHQPTVAQAMQISALEAELYCDSQRDDLIAHGLIAAETWNTDYLVGLSLDAPRPDPATVALLALASKPEARVTIESGAVQVHPSSVTVHQPPAKPTKKKITFQKRDGEPTGATIEET